ncbi:hypothetical protein EDD86DRAFT_208069 [Gorgonomyces haynaldii]|nr:hypothetical protein EDD86DRAFT_208069 [Gorgonomyces haynaldii]
MYACDTGHQQIVKLVLKDRRIDLHTSIYFLKAVSRGHVYILELLLSNPRTQPQMDNNAALINACCQGRLEMVQMLLKDQRVDPADRQGESIVRASISGHLQVVDLLLRDGRVGPQSRDNQALLDACELGHMDVVKRLLMDPRVHLFNDDNKILAQSMDDVQLFTLLFRDPWLNFAERADFCTKFCVQNPEIVKLFMVHDSFDPHIVDRHFLVFCAVQGSDQVLQLLLKSPRIQRMAQELNLLVTAAGAGQTETIQVLLESSTVEGQVSRAMQVAQTANHSQIMWLLLSHQLGSVQVSLSLKIQLLIISFFHICALLYRELKTK